MSSFIASEVQPHQPPSQPVRRRGAIPPPLQLPARSTGTTGIDVLILAAEILESASVARSEDGQPRAVATATNACTTSSAHSGGRSVTLPPTSPSETSSPPDLTPLWAQRSASRDPSLSPLTPMSSSWSEGVSDAEIDSEDERSGLKAFTKRIDVTKFSITRHNPESVCYHRDDESDSESTHESDPDDESDFNQGAYTDDESASASDTVYSSDFSAHDIISESVASRSRPSRKSASRPTAVERAGKISARKRVPSLTELDDTVRKRARSGCHPQDIRDLLKERIRRAGLLGEGKIVQLIHAGMPVPRACQPPLKCVGLNTKKLAQVAESPGTAEEFHMEPIPGSNECPFPGCSFVLSSGTRKDLRRHIGSHYPDKIRCGGVTLQQAAALGIRAYNERTVFEWEGVKYVGGCLRTYSRHDSLRRHLEHDESWCVGDLLAPYQGRDYEGQKHRPDMQRIHLGGRVKMLLMQWE